MLRTARILARTALLALLLAPMAEAGTTLQVAVRDGDLAAVRGLVQAGADVNARLGDGSTVLHWAADREDAGMVRLLLEAGADVGVANDYGVTPLAIAAAGRRAEVVALLLAAGADPNSALPTGETVLMAAARSGVVPVVDRLLAAGADPDAREAIKGQTALMWAIAEGHRDVVRLMVVRGASRSLRTAGGFSAFLFAVREGHRDLVHEFLARGANVNEADGTGASALHVAVIRGHLDIAKDLLARGADPNAAGCGYTVLHWVAGTWETIHSHDYIFNQTAVNRVHEWAVLAGVVDRAAKHDLIRMLLAHGADINARVTKALPEYGFALFKYQLTVGATPFFIASITADVPTMALLLERGADPAIAAADGNTPLIIAAGLARVPNETRVPESQVLEGVTFLLERGAPINTPNAAGVTPLHAATMAGLDGVVGFLVEHGAAVNARTKKGETPLKLANGFEDSALFFMHPSTAALLTRLGGTE